MEQLSTNTIREKLEALKTRRDELVTERTESAKGKFRKNWDNLGPKTKKAVYGVTAAATLLGGTGIYYATKDKKENEGGKGGHSSMTEESARFAKLAKFGFKEVTNKEGQKVFIEEDYNNGKGVRKIFSNGKIEIYDKNGKLQKTDQMTKNNAKILNREGFNITIDTQGKTNIFTVPPETNMTNIMKGAASTNTPPPAPATTAEVTPAPVVKKTSPIPKPPTFQEIRAEIDAKFDKESAERKAELNKRLEEETRTKAIKKILDLDAKKVVSPPPEPAPAPIFTRTAEETERAARIEAEMRARLDQKLRAADAKADKERVARKAGEVAKQQPPAPKATQIDTIPKPLEIREDVYGGYGRVWDKKSTPINTTTKETLTKKQQKKKN